MKPTKLGKARLLGRASAMAGLLVMLEGCPPNGPAIGSLPYNSREKIGIPATAVGTPVIDGIAQPGEGWINSPKIFLEDGASVKSAFMQTMSDASNVYIYIETEVYDQSMLGSPGAYNPNDAVILAMNASGKSDDFKRIHLFPCASNPCNAASPTGFDPSVQWEDGVLQAGDTVQWTLHNTPPPGIEVKANAAPNGSNGRWAIEMKIPRNTTYQFPATGTFGLFADVITVNPGTADALQASWPLGTIIGSTQNDVSNGTIENAALQLPRWGQATLDTSGWPSGLQITGFGNIGANPSKISITGANEFFATIANSPTGPGADINNVAATFQISNFGLGAFSWGNIPVPTNPTPANLIKLHEYRPFTSGQWLLSPADQTKYNTPQTQHQCVRVLVSVNGVDVPALARQYNMDFVQVNSPFEENMQIDLAPWRKVFDKAESITLAEKFFNVGEGFKWQSSFDGADTKDRHGLVIRSLDAPSKQIRSSVLVGPMLTLPSQVYPIDPVKLSQQGQVMDIAVRPGTVMTLLADGEARIKGRSITAAGLNPDDAKRAGIEGERIADSLRPGNPVRTGALLGSFDGFKTTFAIGSGTTLYVPARASRLQIRFAQGLPFEAGGYSLRTVITAPNPVALDGLPLDYVRKAGVPVLLPLGQNLPMHIVRGTVNTGVYLTIKGKEYKSSAPIGSYGALITSVRGSTQGGGDIRIVGRPAAVATPGKP